MINDYDDMVSHWSYMIDYPGDTAYSDRYVNGTQKVPEKDLIKINLDYQTALAESDTRALSMDEIDTLLRFDLPEPKIQTKYREEEFFKDIQEYILDTYKGHYVGNDGKVQSLDLIAANDHAEGFCAGNALKYITRYGKKGGKNKIDIYKAIHYCLLLLHFTQPNEMKD